MDNLQKIYIKHWTGMGADSNMILDQLAYAECGDPYLDMIVLMSYFSPYHCPVSFTDYKYVKDNKSYLMGVFDTISTVYDYFKRTSLCEKSKDRLVVGKMVLLYVLHILCHTPGDSCVFEHPIQKTDSIHLLYCMYVDLPETTSLGDYKRKLPPVKHFNEYLYENL